MCVCVCVHVCVHVCVCFMSEINAEQLVAFAFMLARSVLENNDVEMKCGMP